MVDYLYKSEEVDDDVRPIFNQLVREFGGQYQIWRRVEDFGRRLSAGILDPSSLNAATITLRSTKTKKRKELLGGSELQQIREHLSSSVSRDDLKL